jgi:outer membrane protein
MRNTRLALLIFLTVSFSYQLFAQQKVWSLEDCINHALENNINIRQSQLNTSFAKNNLLQSKMDLYAPLINGSVSHNFNFSNSVDPLTFQFVTQNTQSTVFAISGSYSVFEGMSRVNNLHANKNELMAVGMEVEEIKNNTRILITNLYLQVLVAQEVLQISKERQKLTLNQLENTRKLVASGTMVRGELLESEAQLANDELAIVNAENNLERVLNQLKNLLQIDPFEPFEIQKIDLNDEVQLAGVDAKGVVSGAMNNLPNLKGAEFRLMAAEKRLKSSKGSLSPSLSVSGRMGTNYFSLAQEQKGVNNFGRIPIGTVGQTGPLVFSANEFTTPIFDKLTFGQQFERNINEAISLNLNVPIFGKWQRMIAIDNAKINILNAQYTIESKKIQLQEEAFNAYTDMRASQKRYEAAGKSVAASSESFKYAEERFKVGLVTALEFETTKNRLIAAQADFIQAKYEFAFRKMIVNFYESGNLNF